MVGLQTTKFTSLSLTTSLLLARLFQHTFLRKSIRKEHDPILFVCMGDCKMNLATIRKQKFQKNKYNIKLGLGKYISIGEFFTYLSILMMSLTWWNGILYMFKKLLFSLPKPQNVIQDFGSLRSFDKISFQLRWFADGDVFSYTVWHKRVKKAIVSRRNFPL